MILSVSQFVSTINETLKAVWDTTGVAIEGEVSGYRVSQGQWVNFDLKDEDALVSCFSVLAKLPFTLEDGMRLRVYGTPRVYQKYGKFSFSVDRVEVVGEGMLRKALALLRTRLESEGLFDVSRKRALLRFPARIALVASPESAAYGDVVRILGERWGGLEIDVYPVMVQGEKAAGMIVAAFDTLRTHGVYDAVVLTRGGGSFEELMTFNDERVVRALFACPFPTLVGIGHERDLTLAEEVADVRGSTPTDCARRLVPDRADVLYEVQTLATRSETAFERMIERGKQLQERLSQSMQRWHERLIQEAVRARTQLDQATDRWFLRLRERLFTWKTLLEAVNPERVLARGYAILLDAETEKPLMRAQSLTVGMRLRIRLQDGSVRATLDGREGTTMDQLSLFYGSKKETQRRRSV